MPVHFLPPRRPDELPPSARVQDPERGVRLLTSPLLEELQKTLPADGLATLALTIEDLTPNGRGRWVFGLASPIQRVGACSFHRNGDPHDDFTLCLRRTLKTSLHETGHLLGLPHCPRYECAMNGSSSREESDSHPLWFCPEDEMKVWLACRLDPAERYRKLAEFAASSGLEAEARFWRASLQALR
jgi:archaemetzincin